MNDLKQTITEQMQQLQALMHRATFQRFMGEARGHSQHRGQGRVLAILKLKPRISQRELTYLLNMSKQALAELLTKLERSGYIVREPSEEDKRAMNICLTEAGIQAAERMDDDTFDSAQMLDCLNEDELKMLSDYLERMIHRYEELFPDEHFEERRRFVEEFMAGRVPGFDGFGGPRGGFRGPREGFQGPRGGFGRPRGGFEEPCREFRGPRCGADGRHGWREGPGEGPSEGRDDEPDPRR